MALGRQHDIQLSHDEPSHEHSDERAHERLLECVEECLNCLAVCTTTLQHCLAKGGALSDIHLVGVLMDCAEICQTNANFMLRGSPFHVVTCSACAELCRACEETCRAIRGDEQLEQCADECALAAAACGEMAATERGA
jgi:hypothetical protein